MKKYTIVFIAVILYCFLFNACSVLPPEDSSLTTGESETSISSQSNEASIEIDPSKDSTEEILLKAKEIWENIQPNFQEMLNIFYMNGIQTDSTDVKTIDQYEFYKSIDKKYSTLQDVKNLVYRVLSEKYAWPYTEGNNDGWLFWGNSPQFPMFFEIDGELCVCPSETVECLPTFDEDTLSVEDVSDNGLTINIEGTDKGMTDNPVSFIINMGKNGSLWLIENIQEIIHEASTATHNDLAKAKKIWNEVAPKYLEMGKLINLADVEVDSSDFLSEYYPVTDERYQSVNDVNEVLYQVLTKSYADSHYSYLFSEESPIFKDVDGKLYALNAAYVYHLDYDEDTIYVIKLADTELEFTIDNIQTGNIVNKTFKLVKENDEWLIDDVTDNDSIPFLDTYENKRLAAYKQG